MKNPLLQALNLYATTEEFVMKTAHLIKRYRASVPQVKNQVSVNNHSDSSEDSWMTPREAADYLRLSYKRLLNMSSNGQVPYHKLGNSNRYLKSELILMLNKSRRGLKL